MFTAIEAYRRHAISAYISDGCESIRVDLRILEAINDNPARGAFDVDGAVFHHPNGRIRRTFVGASGTSHRRTLEGLLHGPTNWFHHMTALPDSYRGMVEWIEACPDQG
ncbi:hypothetical protein [Mesoterricola silvestris]|uniref:Uncharacterized protein n=1 Tax=Mesoterricola silvestris TaxID=2927979 RepID=A0AA48GR24_9BACT|nr:hypothetical protein [Mesoterricola silvestris]BDU74140.1 hypothetical protein METEAL_33140 [Mesoterricola silvestris]